MHQNIGEDNESKLVLAEKATLAAKNIDILSTSSNKTQRPVFADPLFQLMQKQINLLQSIITILSTSPATFNSIPCTANPDAGTLVSSLASLKIRFEKLKTDGKSSFIKIN